MTDRPILFSGPMVRALLEGRKTQTRRVITQARVFATPEMKPYTLKGDNLLRALQNASDFCRVHENGWAWQADAYEWQAPATRTNWTAHIGHAPGDRLWVRESGCPNYFDEDKPAYKADWNEDAVDGFPKPKWIPSIHMPRWTSRLTLDVTDVRIERLQDISVDDERAEGVDTSKDAYDRLWDSLNAKRDGGKYAWAANPWVVAVTFEVHKGNIGKMEGGA